MKALCSFKLRDLHIPQGQKRIINTSISTSTNTRLQNGLFYPTNILLRTYAKPKNPAVIHRNNTPTLTYIHKKNKPQLQKDKFKRERMEELRKLNTIAADEDVIMPQTSIPFRGSRSKLQELEEDENLLFNKAVLRAQEERPLKKVDEPDEEEDESAAIEEAEKEGQLLEQELQEDENEPQTDAQSALVAKKERAEALAAKHLWLKMTLDKPIVQLVQEKRYLEAEQRFMKLSADPTFHLTPQIFQAMLECYGKTKQSQKIHGLIAASVQKIPLKAENKPLLPAKLQQTISLDIATYESIIKSLGTSQDLSLMMDYFHEMVNIKQMKPSLMLMNSMIHSYACADDAIAVDKCFKLLKQSGLRPNVHTYGLVMEYFQKRGDLKLVANYHDLMVKQGVEPTVDIWRTLVKACKKSFQYDLWNLKQTRGVWHFVKRTERKKLGYSEAEQIRMKRLLSNFKALVQDL